MKRKKKSFIRQPEDDSDGQLLPILSLMVILIPLLLGNVAFYHFTSISVSVPGKSEPRESQAIEEKEKEDDDEKKVMAQMLISGEKIELKLLDESSGETVDEFIIQNQNDFEKMGNQINEWQEKYSTLSTILVSTEKSVQYRNLVTSLNFISDRQQEEEKLDEDKTKLHLVLVPWEDIH